MKKEFDEWNLQKKGVQENEKRVLYHEREIWWCSLGVNVGFEQDGTGKEYQRPVLVLKGFSRHVCLIVPLTTSTKTNPYHVTVGLVDGREAFAIFSQVRLVDARRLVNKLGTLDSAYFENVKSAVREML